MTVSLSVFAAAVFVLAFAVIFHAIVHRGHTMQIADAVSAIEAAATTLGTVPAQITAAIAAGDATALATLDGPVASLQSAVSAISAALPPAA